MEFLRHLYYKTLALFPKKMALHIEFFRGHKRIMNLKNPIFLGEKIQWMKLYANLERYSNYVDKIEVRKYVREKVGEKYLNEEIGTYSFPEEINFEQLPKKFVIKGTHGAKHNLICRDKATVDITKVKAEMHQWLKEDFSALKREAQYSNIQPRLLCEKYLEDDTGELRDYKIFCFNGVPKMIEVISSRSRGKHMSLDHFDSHWNRLEIYKNSYSRSEIPINRPSCLDEMLMVSKGLAEGFPFVRVDLYLLNQAIIFGELTFTPDGGTRPYMPLAIDKEIASWIDLSLFKAEESSKKWIYGGGVHEIQKLNT